MKMNKVINQIWEWEQKGHLVTLQTTKPGRKNKYSIQTKSTLEVMTEEEIENKILMFME